jgi:hypothetical protein
MVDYELVAAAIVDGPDLAPDDTFRAAEETDHVPCIGTANPSNRGQNRAQGSGLRADLKVRPYVRS